MNFEIKFMHPNLVWTLVNPPEGIVLISCKWVFKGTISKDRQIETCKAHLVVKHYSQRQGLDYKKTFLPIAIIKLSV